MIDRIKSVSNRRLRECILCGAKVENLKIHLRTHSQEPRLQCSVCEKTFTQIGHRNKHIREVHNVENQYSCKLCERNFDTLMCLDDHMRIHITNDRLCKICDRVLPAGCITSHLRTHTGQKQYRCNVCPTSFSRKNHLEEHLATLHPGYEKLYQCSECDEAFSSSNSYKRHAKLHENSNKAGNGKIDGEKTVCSICGKKINKKNFLLHMRVHSKVKPHKCSLCQICFTQKSNLDKHMNIHTGGNHFLN